MTAIQDVGHEHARRGIKPDEMRKFGEAILEAVKELMGDDVDAEAVEVWQKLVNIVRRQFNKGLTQGRKEQGIDDDDDDDDES